MGFDLQDTLRAARAEVSTYYQGVIDSHSHPGYQRSVEHVITPLLAVVDDDISVRESLQSLIRSAGMAVRVFGSAEEFLNSVHPNKPDCLILDVCMPGMSGIELHRHLLARGCKVPAVFITAHASDDQGRSQPSSGWTVAYLNKPFNDDELLNAVHAALRLKSTIRP